MIKTARTLHNLLTTIMITSVFTIGSHVLSHAAPKYIPVLNGYLSTGQWYFEGERSALGGNAHLTFIPALRFSNRFSLIPTIETNYRGTRSTDELAGGSNLFQDTWENAIGVKAVHSFGKKWKVREKIKYRTKFFRETTNESLGKGLYDYEIYSVGTELERKWGKRYSIALGYDFSFLKFPNYNSLIGFQRIVIRKFQKREIVPKGYGIPFSPFAFQLCSYAVNFVVV